ncbi:PLP-dependent aminotransferase family protein [Phyllobacterium zundukense]|uniref:PLP-dependent aminotransferase family protein n=1 Tax=Phyllobacterium zundukense TaxID=1867719 RepID=A0ACD4CV79_9HYPH|nr:PLP-dependent aminotransferase family protein [Phyllobacterium zundukense]UXN57507.1 PLP-dependent aminotransferase family protein [Phyllobacterium zundukense]
MSILKLADREPIDMTRTMPPDIAGLNLRIRASLANVANLDDLDFMVQRHRFFGSESEKELAADWLGKRLGFTPSADRLYISGGTQNCLQILMPRLVGTGNCLATEMMSYAGISQICRLFDIRVAGVEIDEYGLVPDAFARVCERERPKVLYCNPTIHNPTTSILSVSRRSEIAEIARRNGVIIIEDDVHGKLMPNAPPPIASIAPDITWYLMSVSKCIGMGLRVAFLVSPEDEAAFLDLCTPIQSISSWFVPGISSAIVADLIKSGAADEIATEIQKEVAARQAIASGALKGFSFLSKNASLHLWLSLPDHWKVSDLVSAVRRDNVLMRASDLFNAGGITMPNKVRLSLVAPKTRAELSFALERIVENLNRYPPAV